MRLLLSCVILFLLSGLTSASSKKYFGGKPVRELVARQQACEQLDLQCRGEGETCGCPISGTTDCFICSDGYECSSGTCAKLPLLGEKCTDSCYSPEGWAIQCVGGLCQGKDAFVAGENCLDDDTVASSGGCLQGLTCMSGTCSPLLALGEDCSSTPSGCGPVAFCNIQTGICEALLDEGANCTGLGDACKQTLDCVQGTCVKYFSVEEGGKCQPDFFASSCRPGLYCDPGDTTCKQPTNVGKSCTTSVDCGIGTTCACDTWSGESSCQVFGVRTQDEADALLAYVQCAQDNDANDNVQAFKGNLIAAHCMDEYRDVVSAIFGSSPCAAAGLTPVISIVAVMLALLWLL